MIELLVKMNRRMFVQNGIFFQHENEIKNIHNLIKELSHGCGTQSDQPSGTQT